MKCISMLIYHSSKAFRYKVYEYIYIRIMYYCALKIIISHGRVTHLFMSHPPFFLTLGSRNWADGAETHLHSHVPLGTKNNFQIHHNSWFVVFI